MGEVEAALFPDEDAEELLVKGYRIIQKRTGYRFGHDSVYLGAFATLHARDRVLDLGCGDGVLLFLLAAREESMTGVGVERREDAADRAKRGAHLNGLEERLQIVCGDILNHPFERAAFDLVIANPPYWPQSFADPEGARTEAHLTPENLADAAAYALRPRGRLALIVPCARLDAFLAPAFEKDFSLKRLQMIHPSSGRPGRAALLELQIHTKRGGCAVLPPLTVRKEGNQSGR